jgi:hypothetical protein
MNHYLLPIPDAAAAGPHPLLGLVLCLWLLTALVSLAPGTAGIMRSAWRARRSPLLWLLVAGIAVAVRVGGSKPPLPPQVQDQRLIRLYYQEQGARYVPIDSIIRRGWQGGQP